MCLSPTKIRVVIEMNSNHTQHPLVSVIIPTYNRAALLVETVESVLAQTYPAIEIIVVDDGSTDGTAQVLEGYRGRVVTLSQSNQGETVARNAGFRAAHGQYISFLDDDDLILPTKIEKQVRLLETRPDVGIVYCRYYHIDEKGTRLSKSGLLPEGQILLQLALSDFIWAGGPLIRRSCLEKVGAYDETLPWNGRYAEDWDMWLRLALAGYTFACIQEPLGAYRLTRTGQTANITPSEDGNLAVLDKLFAQPSLPPEVAAAKNRIYAATYLWLSTRYYAAQQWESAQRTLRQAIHYDPTLLQPTDTWRHNMATQALSYRVADPIQFVSNSFAHLPEEADSLRSCQDMLLGHVHMQLALHHYYTEQIAAAQQHLLAAVALQPITPQQFVETLSQATFHFPLTDFRPYVDRVLVHLPAAVQAWRETRPQILGHIHLALAFEAFANQQQSQTLRHTLTALRYQPRYVQNRGVLSIFLKSLPGFARLFTRS